jgi:hypothetical protein
VTRGEAGATLPGNRPTHGSPSSAREEQRGVKANYPAAQYQRLKPKRGHKRALGAVKHSLLSAIWHMLSTGATYRDVGADYFTRRDPERQTRRLVGQLERLGHHGSGGARRNEQRDRGDGSRDLPIPRDTRRQRGLLAAPSTVAPTAQGVGLMILRSSPNR